MNDNGIKFEVRRCESCEHYIKPTGKGHPRRCAARNGVSVELLLYCTKYKLKQEAQEDE